MAGTETDGTHGSARNGRNCPERPELPGMQAGTGCFVCCAALVAGTRCFGHSGRYRNGIDNYGILMGPQHHGPPAVALLAPPIRRAWMGPYATTGMQKMATRPCIPACRQMLGSTSALSVFGRAICTRTGFASSSKATSAGPLVSSNCKRVVVRAIRREVPKDFPLISRVKEHLLMELLMIMVMVGQLKALTAAGAEILVGTWVHALNIFKTSLRRGRFDESRKLPDGSLMEIAKVYPLDAVYDTPEDVLEDVKANKRYAGASNWTVKEVAETLKNDFGSIDILVHSLANGPEVTKPLLETSRRGYLAAISASSYSYVSLLQHFLPIMNPGGASISLTYIASERTIPGFLLMKQVEKAESE